MVGDRLTGEDPARSSRGGYCRGSLGRWTSQRCRRRVAAVSKKSVRRDRKARPVSDASVRQLSRASFPPSLDRANRGLLTEAPATEEADASRATATQWRSANGTCIHEPTCLREAASAKAGEPVRNGRYEGRGRAEVMEKTGARAAPCLPRVTETGVYFRLRWLDMARKRSGRRSLDAVLGALGLRADQEPEAGLLTSPYWYQAAQ
jgi:hypothetical protein